MNASLFDRANHWVAEQLGTATGLAGFGLLFVGGALASLLPCVYPLFPITAAVLAKRQSSLGRLAHPFAYYGGLGSAYFLLGIIASLTGGSFNDLLRMPIANLVIGALLLALSLATVGLLHFPVLAGGGDDRADGLWSTSLMGATAGFLSSACVGPIVVGILLSIATSATGVSPGAALLAATKMMLFGFGVGLPLLLIGVFGVSLPKAGRWMIAVQWVFGGLIAWFATGYVAKGLAGLGYSAQTNSAVLLGAVLLFAAVFFAEDAEKPVHGRTKRAIVVLTGVVGFFVLGRAILSGAAVPVAAAAVTGTPVEAPRIPTEKKGNLVWNLDKRAAYEEASRDGKSVFIDFHGDWCTNCKAFQEQTQSDHALNAALAGATLLKVKDSTALFDEYKNDTRFPELKVGLPFFVITDPKGTVVYKTNDYTRTSEMMMFLTN